MLDALTALAIAAPLLGLMAGLVWLTTGGHPSPAVGWWCGGSACLALSITLLGSGAPPVAAHHAARLLALLAPLCWTQSLRELAGHGWRLRQGAFAVALAAVGYALLQALDAPVRGAGMRIGGTLLLLLAAAESMRLSRRLASTNAAAIAAIQVLLAGCVWLQLAISRGAHLQALPFGDAWDTGVLAAFTLVLAAMSHLCFTGLVLDLHATARLETLRAATAAAAGQGLGGDARQLERQRQTLLMLGALGHELNQPLTVALAQAQMAQRRLKAGKAEPQAMADLLAKTEAALLRTSAILDRIRTPAGSPGSALAAQVDLRHVVADAMVLVSPEWQDRRLELADRTPGPAVPCRGDAVALVQVMVNLLRNATQAMQGQDAVRFEIDCDARDGNGVVTLRDGGPGFPAALLARWGEPFVASSSEGLGLGLAICRKIVAEHGGSLTLRNLEQGGAEAVLTIPLDRAPA